MLITTIISAEHWNSNFILRSVVRLWNHTCLLQVDRWCKIYTSMRHYFGNDIGIERAINNDAKSSLLPHINDILPQNYPFKFQYHMIAQLNKWWNLYFWSLTLQSVLWISCILFVIGSAMKVSKQWFVYHRNDRII